MEDTASEDEAIEYSENGCCIGAFSLCLPTNDDEGKMHSNTLIKIKRKSFAEYIEAVTYISNSLAEEN